MWLIGTQRPSPAQVKCASWYRNWLQKSVIKNIIIILLATQTTFVDNCCSKFHPHFLVLSSVQSCTSVPSSALFHYHIRFDLKICGFGEFGQNIFGWILLAFFSSLAVQVPDSARQQYSEPMSRLVSPHLHLVLPYAHKFPHM